VRLEEPFRKSRERRNSEIKQEQKKSQTDRSKFSAQTRSISFGKKEKGRRKLANGSIDNIPKTALVKPWRGNHRGEKQFADERERKKQFIALSGRVARNR